MKEKGDVKWTVPDVKGVVAWSSQQASLRIGSITDRYIRAHMEELGGGCGRGNGDLPFCDWVKLMHETLPEDSEARCVVDAIVKHVKNPEEVVISTDFEGWDIFIGRISKAEDLDD